MRPPSLRRRIRNGTLLMLGIALVLGTLAVPTVHRLGGAIGSTLYSNYTSIKSAHEMERALYELEIAQRRGTLSSALPDERARMLRSLNVEKGNVTEAGEAELVREIEQRWGRLLDELNHSVPSSGDGHGFAVLHQLLQSLSDLNEAAMFRADSRANSMSGEVASEFTIGLTVLLLFGTALSLTLARNISSPLSELSAHLRNFNLPGKRERVKEQPIAELQAVATEFNKMADRLEQFEKLNVDRLVLEKNKTEAILESIEDGVILIDDHAAIAHINEVAATVLGVERESAVGQPFYGLEASRGPGQRINAALRDASVQPGGPRRMEVDARVRGQQHTYLLKAVPLRPGERQSFGNILVLQDVTYLRDRANLVATLSHELKTPLTSLAAAAELLQDARSKLDPKEQELVTTINEDLGIMRQLADDLLALARGEAGSIAIRSVKLDVAQIVRSVMRTFALQAEQKGVSLESIVGKSLPEVSADPVKLSWVFSNLIANALRYTPNGGSVTVSSSLGTSDVQLKVRDSGVGIAPGVITHLFERFSQWDVDGSLPGSAGLGLAIAKDIVEAHGGRILVDSTVGAGTCFTVELPLPTEDSWHDF